MTQTNIHMTLKIRSAKESLAAICSANPNDPRCPRPQARQLGGGGGGGGGGGFRDPFREQVQREQLNVNNVNKSSTVIPPDLPTKKKETAAEDRALIKDSPPGEPLVEELPDPGDQTLRETPASLRIEAPRPLEIDRFPDAVSDISRGPESFRGSSIRQGGGIIDDDSSIRSSVFRPSGQGELSQMNSARSFHTAGDGTSTTSTTLQDRSGIRTMRPATRAEIPENPQLIQESAIADTIHSERPAPGPEVRRPFGENEGVKFPQDGESLTAFEQRTGHTFEGPVSRDLGGRGSVFSKAVRSGRGGERFGLRKLKEGEKAGSRQFGELRLQSKKLDFKDFMARNRGRAQAAKTGEYDEFGGDYKGYSFLDDKGFEGDPRSVAEMGVGVEDVPPPPAATATQGVITEGEQALETAKIGEAAGEGVFTEIGETIGEALL